MNTPPSWRSLLHLVDARLRLWRTWIQRLVDDRLASRAAVAPRAAVLQETVLLRQVPPRAALSRPLLSRPVIARAALSWRRLGLVVAAISAGTAMIVLSAAGYTFIGALVVLCIAGVVVLVSLISETADRPS